MLRGLPNLRRDPLSAQITGPPKSVPEIFAEIQASQAAQAAALADLRSHIGAQQAFLSYRFDDFPGN